MIYSKYFLLFTLLFIQLSVALASQVSGVATLENSDSHTEILIQFVANSNSAVSKQVSTNESGAFVTNLNNGVYSIIYSKNNFTSYILDNVVIEGDVVLSTVELLARVPKDISGLIRGTLYRDTTYFVKGNLIVEANTELSIEPGTHIKFDGKYSMTVNGKLIAEGEENDSILFTSNKTNKQAADWLTILLKGNDTSKINYCVLEYAGSESDRFGIITSQSKGSALISNSRIEHSERGGIYFLGSGYAAIENNKIGYSENTNVYINTSSSGYIKNNEIYGGEVRGIFHENAAIEVSGNLVSNCYAGIWTVTTGEIRNNILVDCTNGVYTFDGTNNLLIANNTFINNEYGVAIENNVNISPRIENNIFQGNENGIGFTYYEIQGRPSSIAYNLFFNNDENYSDYLTGFENLVTENVNGTPSDPYYNIFIDPLLLLTNMESPYFGSITEGSPAINASKQGIDIGAFQFNNIAPQAFSLDTYEWVYYSYDSLVLNWSWQPSIDEDGVGVPLYYQFTISNEDTLYTTESLYTTNYALNDSLYLEQNTTYTLNGFCSDGLSETVVSNPISITTPNLSPSEFTIQELNILNRADRTSKISIKWSPNLDTDPLAYEIFLGLNGAFELVAMTTLDSLSFNLPLLENTAYQCFVLASDAELSVASDTIDFLSPNIAPSVFTQKYPAADSTLADRNVVFSWEKAEDQSEVSYTLTLFNNQEYFDFPGLDTTFFNLNTVANLKPGSEYLWKVTASDGVDSTYTFARRLFTGTVLSQDQASFDTYRLFPNPAQNTLYIDNKSNNASRYLIIDPKGNHIISGHLSVEQTIDISYLASGVYVLQITDINTSQVVGVQRFLKD